MQIESVLVKMMPVQKKKTLIIIINLCVYIKRPNIIILLLIMKSSHINIDESSTPL